MDVLAQWPAAFVVGGGEPAPKLASDTSLEGLVQRLALGAVAWELELEPFSKVAAEAPLEDGRNAAVTMATIWRHPEAHPLALLTLVLNLYGDDALEWDPEVLKMTLERDGYALSQSTLTKLMAARTLMLSPSPWRQWHVFAAVARALAGIPPNFAYLEEPEIGHLMLAIDCMRLVDPERTTTDEVDKFVAAVLKHEGLTYAPPPIDFAQHELESPKIECMNCHAVHRDDGDVRCVTCGGALLQKLPYVFADVRDGTRALWEKYYKRPFESALAAMPKTPEGVAAGHLLREWDYAKTQRVNLRQQLKVLR